MDVAYGPLPAQRGDLYAPVEPLGPRPAVLVIHGGGWTAGSRRADSGLAQLIAAKGVVVFNIDYRLADPAKPNTRWPAQLVDAQLAVRFLRANAAQFGIDPARVGAIGDSAGGHLAVFLGVLPTNVPGEGAELFPHERPNVSAVVDQFGPMDLATMFDMRAANPAMFGSITPDTGALQSASPLPLVNIRAAQMFIVHGLNDTVVPFQHSVLLTRTLQAHGARPVFMSFNGGHGYVGLPPEEVAKLQNGEMNWLLAALQR